MDIDTDDRRIGIDEEGWYTYRSKVGAPLSDDEVEEGSMEVGEAEEKGLMPPSLEQQEVVDAISEGYSVIVDSVAGSGKTTCIAHVATSNRSKHFLVVAFNHDLRMETKAKLSRCHVDNVEIHTFHSLGRGYYNPPNCHTDEGLKYIIQNSPKTTTELPRFYPQLLVVGDVRQCIYAFRGADPRYLTRADQLFRFHEEREGERRWKRLKLTVSYRVTDNVAKFVDVAMQVRNGIKSYETHGPAPSSDPSSLPLSPRVKYVTGSKDTVAVWVARQIVKLIKEDHVSPGDIFILSPFNFDPARSWDPNGSLLKILETNDIDVFISCKDYEERLDKRATNGKVVYTTHHKSKGRERPYVFVMTFNSDYFKGKTGPRTICPNILYVAATRSTKLLCFAAEDPRPNACSDGGPRVLKFLDRELITHPNFKRYCHYLNLDEGILDGKGATTTTTATTEANKGKGKNEPFNSALDSGRFSIMSERVFCNDKWCPRAHASSEKEVPSKGRKWTPEKLLEFVDSDVLMECFKMMNVEIILRQDDDKNTIQLETEIGVAGGKIAPVEVLNRIGLKSMFAQSFQPPGKMWMLETLETTISNMDEEGQAKEMPKLEQFYRRINEKENISFHLELALYHERLLQQAHSINIGTLPTFKWITNAQVAACMSNMHQYHNLSHPSPVNIVNEVICVPLPVVAGRAVVNSTVEATVQFHNRTDVWELTFLHAGLNAPKQSHVITLGIIAWVWKQKYPGVKKTFKLFNVLTNEVWTIKPADDSKLQEMVFKLIDFKNLRSEALRSDEEFLSLIDVEKRRYNNDPVTAVADSLSSVTVSGNSQGAYTDSSRSDPSVPYAPAVGAPVLGGALASFEAPPPLNHIYDYFGSVDSSASTQAADDL